MELIWILVETLAVFVEITMYLFFLHRRFRSKNDSVLPQLFAWVVIVSWGLFATFSGLSIFLYEAVFLALMFTYIFLSKEGSVFARIFGVVLTVAIMLTTSLIGAGIAVSLTQSTFQHSLTNQDTSRLVAIVMIKMMQIIIFYALAMKPSRFHSLKKRPIWILTGIAFLILLCVTLIWVLAVTVDIDEQTSSMLILVSAGMLIVMVFLFVMYELFVREETRNITLQSELQRLELQTQFYREIDAMYSDIRNWRHDYKNNLIALRGFIESSEADKALEYIDSITNISEKNRRTLQTGNLALDAVVSSKLWLAQSYGIETSIQAVYPNNNSIQDNDFCSLVGNLLDNAIEACERMVDDDRKRFIDFTLLTQGKNLTLTISNSYSGELRRSKDRYLSIKEGTYHGIGMSLIDSVVDKYQGHIIREQKAGVFNTKIMLPLIEQGA